MCAHNGTHIDAPMEVHHVLFGNDVVIRLSEVLEDIYYLNTAPLNLSGVELYY